MTRTDDAQRVVAYFDIEIEKRHQLAVGRYSRHHRWALLSFVQHGADGILEPELSTDCAHNSERVSIRSPIRATHAFQHLSWRAATKWHASQCANIFATQQDCHLPTRRYRKDSGTGQRQCPRFAIARLGGK